MESGQLSFIELTCFYPKVESLTLRIYAAIYNIISTIFEVRIFIAYIIGLGIGCAFTFERLLFCLTRYKVI